MVNNCVADRIYSCAHLLDTAKRMCVKLFMRSGMDSVDKVISLPVYFNVVGMENISMEHC